MDPTITNSKGYAKYVLTFVDDHSRYVVTYFLQAKTKVLMKFEEFKILCERQWNARLKCLRSDNGSEFVNKAMDPVESHTRKRYHLAHSKMAWRNETIGQSWRKQDQ